MSDPRVEVALAAYREHMRDAERHGNLSEAHEEIAMRLALADADRVALEGAPELAQRIRSLLAEWDAEMDIHPGDPIVLLDESAATIAAQAAEIARLREALAFYANNNNWEFLLENVPDMDARPAVNDAGNRARAALETK